MSVNSRRWSQFARTLLLLAHSSVTVRPWRMQTPQPRCAVRSSLAIRPLEIDPDCRSGRRRKSQLQKWSQARKKTCIAFDLVRRHALSRSHDESPTVVSGDLLQFEAHQRPNGVQTHARRREHEPCIKPALQAQMSFVFRSTNRSPAGAKTAFSLPAALIRRSNVATSQNRRRLRQRPSPIRPGGHCPRGLASF